MQIQSGLCPEPRAPRALAVWRQARSFDRPAAQEYILSSAVKGCPGARRPAYCPLTAAETTKKQPAQSKQISFSCADCSNVTLWLATSFPGFLQNNVAVPLSSSCLQHLFPDFSKIMLLKLTATDKVHRLSETHIFSAFSSGTC